ncbi:MAG: hypothetical protein EPN40_14665, partial [Rhodanobacteraceae bacterium]
MCATAPAAKSATWQAYQRDFYFQQLDGSRGLVQNSVSPIFQDQTGFMWFVTQGGLFRYDGYGLTRYSHDPDHTGSLPEDFRITALANAGDGRLWVGFARDGLTLFDPAT